MEDKKVSLKLELKNCNDANVTSSYSSRCFVNTTDSDKHNRCRTRERLNRRTPQGGINRREYIRLLVDEYYETSNLEAQQQVTANLANFAYDPINWQYLQQAKAHELFYDILQQSSQGVVDRLLVVHAIVGLTNISLHSATAEFIERSNGLKQLRELLEKHKNDCEIVCNILTCLLFLLNEARAHILKQDESLLKTLTELKKTASIRVQHLATVISEELGQ